VTSLQRRRFAGIWGGLTRTGTGTGGGLSKPSSASIKASITSRTRSENFFELSATFLS